VSLLTPDGEQFKYMVHLEFKATNNMAEYEALIFGLSTTLSLGVQQLLVKGNSHSWMRTCSMSGSRKRILKSWTCTTSLVRRVQ
jgi:ribonuclease HI